MSCQRTVDSEVEMFAGLKCWVSRAVKDRNTLLRAIKDHGGQIAPGEKFATHCLVDPQAGKKNINVSPCVYDYKFVLDSIEAGTRLDDAMYEVTSGSRVNRPVGDVLTTRKTTRTRFSVEDDQILYDWITPYRDQVGSYQGLEIYKQLAAKHPHHTFQSWRERYLKYVQYKTNLKVVEDVDPLAAMFHDIPDEIDPRPAKRARVDLDSNSGVLGLAGNATDTELNQAHVRTSTGELASTRERTSAQLPVTTSSSKTSVRRRTQPIRQPQCDVESSNPPPQDSPQTRNQRRPSNEEEKRTTEKTILPRQELLNRTFRNVATDWPDFTIHQARHIYRALPEIHQTTTERLRSSWENFINSDDDWQHLKAERCEEFYRAFIVPEYLRRNGLGTKQELQSHVLTVASIKDGGVLPKVKIEDIPDMRTPIEKQRDNELARAKAETEELLLSDDDTGSTQAPGFRGVPSDSRNKAQINDSNESADVPDDPLAVRPGAQANEGRKRASQSTTQSTSQESQKLPKPTTPSGKKKLFGQRLDLSSSASQSAFQLQTQLEYHLDQSDINAISQQPSTITSTGGTKLPSTSSSSLPTAFKPPVSYQIPRASASTSQESENFETALQTQPLLHSSANGGKGTDDSQDSAQYHAPSSIVRDEQRNSSSCIEPKEQDNNDADDEHDSDDEIESDAEPTDAESEWKGFDDGLANTCSRESAAAIENTLDETAEYYGGETRSETSTDKDITQQPLHAPGDNLHQKALSKDSASEYTIDSEVNGEDPNPVTTNVQNVQEQLEDRVQTQALFEGSLEDDPTVFDIPEPEGGWDAVGLDDLDAVSAELEAHDKTLHMNDADTPLQTVEIVEGWLGSQSRPLEGSECDAAEQTGDMLEVADTEPSHLQAILHNDREIVHTVANTLRPPTSTASQSYTHLPGPATYLLNQTPGALVSGKALKRPIRTEAPAVFDFPSTEELGKWEANQLLVFPDVERRTLVHLANTVLLATSNDIRAATLLLPGVIEKYHRWVEIRAEQKRAKHLKVKPRRPRKKEMRSFLPGHVPGVWTSDDDGAFNGTDDRIKQLESKHGPKGVARRSAFLRGVWLGEQPEQDEDDTTLVTLPQTPAKAAPSVWRKRKRPNSPQIEE